ncbi:MAG: hypothetical protein DSY87_07925, partial [Methylococcus sp.]
MLGSVLFSIRPGRAVQQRGWRKLRREKLKTLRSLVVIAVLAFASGANAGSCWDANKPDVDDCKVWAEQGNSVAQSNLGIIYQWGQGVPEDYKKSVHWYSKAAEQGNADAQSNLGVMYHTGKGVLQDHTKAFEWYSKAAEQGHTAAQSNLGIMYASGKGVSEDYKKSVYWYG